MKITRYIVCNWKLVMNSYKLIYKPVRIGGLYD